VSIRFVAFVKVPAPTTPLIPVIVIAVPVWRIFQRNDRVRLRGAARNFQAKQGIAANRLGG